MNPDRLASTLVREATVLALSLGDDPATQRQQDRVWDMLMQHNPGRIGQWIYLEPTNPYGARVWEEGDREEYCHIFLFGVFGKRNASELLRREAATLLSWFIWDGIGELLESRAQRIGEMTATAEKEMHGLIREVLRMRGDAEYLGFQKTISEVF